jgi:hypothetical protein
MQYSQFKVGKWESGQLGNSKQLVGCGVEFWVAYAALSPRVGFSVSINHHWNLLPRHSTVSSKWENRKTGKWKILSNLVDCSMRIWYCWLCDLVSHEQPNRLCCTHRDQVIRHSNVSRKHRLSLTLWGRWSCYALTASRPLQSHWRMTPRTTTFLIRKSGYQIWIFSSSELSSLHCSTLRTGPWHLWLDRMWPHSQWNDYAACDDHIHSHTLTHLHVEFTSASTNLTNITTNQMLQVSCIHHAHIMLKLCRKLDPHPLEIPSSLPKAPSKHRSWSFFHETHPQVPKSRHETGFQGV